MYIHEFSPISCNTLFNFIFSVRNGLLSQICCVFPYFFIHFPQKTMEKRTEYRVCWMLTKCFQKKKNPNKQEQKKKKWDKQAREFMYDVEDKEMVVGCLNVAPGARIKF